MEGTMTLTIHRLKERPDLRARVFSAAFRPPFWPEFMLHDPAASLYFSAPFFDRYLDYAFAGLADGKVVARAFSVPFAFGTPERSELPDGGRGAAELGIGMRPPDDLVPAAVG